MKLIWIDKEHKHKEGRLTEQAFAALRGRNVDVQPQYKILLPRQGSVEISSLETGKTIATFEYDEADL